MYEAEKIRFMHFLSLNNEDRDAVFGYRTQGEFAKAHGLPHQKILTEWKNHPKFKRDFRKAIEDDFLFDMPAVRKKLRERGVDDGDVAALKEMTRLGGFHEKVEAISESDVMEVISVTRELLVKYLSDQPDILNAISQEFLERLGEE